MRKLLLILLSLCAILLVSCGGPDATPEDVTEEAEELEEEEEEEESEGLGEALTDFTSTEMTCTYEIPNTETVTFYLKEDKFRMEIAMEYQDGRVVSYIYDGDYLWMWGSGTNDGGFKYPAEMMQDGVDTSDAQTDIFELNDAAARDELFNLYNANCIAGAPNSKFTPPSNVDWIDMGEFLENLPQEMQNVGLE